MINAYEKKSRNYHFNKLTISCDFASKVIDKQTFQEYSLYNTLGCFDLDVK